MLTTGEKNPTSETESTHADRTRTARETGRDRGPRASDPRGHRRRDRRTGGQPRHYRRRPPLRRQRVHDPRPRPQDRRQGLRAAPGAKKNGYDGAGVTCPHCGRTAEFHSHRTHTSFSLVGPVRYRRAYYLCRRCGQGLFPFDRDAGLTTRDLTPALERVATLAGTVADSFEKGAELLDEMAGVRVSESTVERTTEDAGQRLADAVEAGATFGPKGDWPWPKDYDGRRCAYVELDATGVRQQGDGGGPAEGRMAYVGMVCNPGPEWPCPDERPGPMRARYLAGLYPLEDFAPLLRRPAGAVGMDRADRWIGLTDGGNGLEGRLGENFPRVEVVILDFYHPAEKLTGLARLLHPKDQARAEDQAGRWRQLLKDEGGAVLAA